MFTASPAVNTASELATGAPESPPSSALWADGYVQSKDPYYFVAQGGSHNEASWAARLSIPLTYLFPWQSTVY